MQARRDTVNEPVCRTILVTLECGHKATTAMSEEDRFDLSFGSIDAGWLPLCLVLNSERFDVNASSVLNDPLFELADAAEALAGEDAVNVCAQLWLEPESVSITFACPSDSRVVRVFVRASAFLDEASSVPFIEVLLDRRVVATTLVHALRSLQRQFPSDAPLPGWGPFPTAMLAAAMTRIEARADDP
jgi:hypothetical protein